MCVRTLIYDQRRIPMTPAQPAPATTRLAATRLPDGTELPAGARLADGTELPADGRLANGTRLADGTELPAVGRWQIDPGHTELAFIGRHFMLTKVRGRFTGLSGVIQIAEEPGDSTVELTIDMASVESGSRARDEHLRSADLFDVVRHPRATFSGHAADWHGTRGLLTGVLTMRETARPVTLQAEYLGYAADPWGGHRAVFTATGTIDREDWGLTWNLPLDGGGLLVSKEIRIEIELEAVLDPEV
jgi:polyisoprenoid-binding protein YceI